MPISAENVRSLQPFDYRILFSLERWMEQYRWVPEDILNSSTSLGAGELQYRIRRLARLGMIRRGNVNYEGYALVFTGYDALALHALTEKGTIRALGPFIGEGKESVVYEALGLGPVVCKLHRVGQRSFQSARKDRGYLPSHGHLPWIFASARSAEKEYAALQLLHPAVSVPLPIDRNRHIVVMSLIRGVTMNRAVLDNPEEILDAILAMVCTAYKRGVIHGDLSEFNVMIGDEGISLIDWPQWEASTHPNAQEILRRDVENILKYFHRKYGITRPLDATVAGVIG
ncbi:MAG: serine/threonine protein phosphatase [Methanomicrobiales archaeon]|nr:serine/threonine protein phosphatase [Methanomicrobiales archaeon]